VTATAIAEAAVQINTSSDEESTADEDEETNENNETLIL